MVSPLWKACSDGDLDTVHAILNGPAPVDLELKDHTGATPLIEAVKNGHIEVVRALLNKGADPSNTASQGRPGQYTSDPVIHELLRSYQAPANTDPGHENAYPNDDPAKNYYAPPQPPPGAYAYYPSINPALPPMGEGGVYYPPPLPQQPQQGGEHSPTGLGHLPPPDIARLIPCRYYPACRYGLQCMFAHPQGSYYPNNAGPHPPPQAQYPQFDPSLGSPYGYYPGPPPPFQPPNGAPMSPLPHVMHHGRSPSELVSPSQGHFPNGGPPPPPLGPYGPMSPSNYPHPGQVSVPMSLQPLPPMHHQAPQGPAPQGPAPHSPTATYNNNVPIAFPGPDSQYFSPPPFGYPEMDGNVLGPNGQPEFVHPNIRDSNGPRRGGSVRRGSFIKPKPPCMFFPAGRCKNGDDCRFPHILSENLGSNHPHTYFASRGGAPRPPRGTNHVNGIAAIGQKMSNMTVRDDAPHPQNGATEGSSRSQSTDPGNRPKYQQGPNKYQNGVNGKRPHPGHAPIRPQRVPSAEDFPVLPGSVTPPTRNGTNGLVANGLSGPTAAQILLAPPPIRKENSKDSVAASETSEAALPAPEQEVAPAPATPAPAPVPTAPTTVYAPAPAASVSVAQRLPLSFAAAAAAKAASTPSAPEASKEVSVSA